MESLESIQIVWQKHFGFQADHSQKIFPQTQTKCNPKPKSFPHKDPVSFHSNAGEVDLLSFNLVKGQDGADWSLEWV